MWRSLFADVVETSSREGVGVSGCKEEGYVETTSTTNGHRTMTCESCFWQAFSPNLHPKTHGTIYGGRIVSLSPQVISPVKLVPFRLTAIMSKTLITLPESQAFSVNVFLLKHKPLWKRSHIIPVCPRIAS